MASREMIERSLEATHGRWFRSERECISAALDAALAPGEDVGDVTRYVATEAGMALSSLGAWVRHSDYAAQAAQIASLSAKVAEVERENADLKLIAEENADNVRILDSIANFLGVPHDEELTLQHVADRATTAEARASELQRENERLEKALRRIAEGNLGDASWEADYEKIRQVARAALQQEGESDAE